MSSESSEPVVVKPVDMEAFVADQMKAATMGRELYAAERGYSGLRAEALNFALRLADMSCRYDVAAIMANAAKFETYLLDNGK